LIFWSTFFQITLKLLKSPYFFFDALYLHPKPNKEIRAQVDIFFKIRYRMRLTLKFIILIVLNIFLGNFRFHYWLQMHWKFST
jgi:hypothetical protein